MEAFKRYYSRKELSAALGVTVETIDTWRRDYGLPFIKVVPSTNAKVIFDIYDIDAYLQRRKYNVGSKKYLEDIVRKGGFQPKKPVEQLDHEAYTSENEDNYDMPPDIY